MIALPDKTNPEELDILDQPRILSARLTLCNDATLHGYSFDFLSLHSSAALAGLRATEGECDARISLP
jgi:hypothetical protein